jgi:MarR family transcriptional regulator, organic hydroperoxide resistance regulator
MDSESSEKKTRRSEQRRAAQMMKRILVHFRSQMDDELRPQGVTTAQLQMLKAIRQEPGASGAQLARYCYITPQSAQVLLQDLERGGWIFRVKEEGHGRSLVVGLTAEGEKLLNTAERLALVIERRLWKGVSDEEVQGLNRALELCLANLESEG